MGLPVFMVCQRIRTLSSRTVDWALIQADGGWKWNFKIVWVTCFGGKWCCRSGYGKELIYSEDLNNFRREEATGEECSMWQRWGYSNEEDWGKIRETVGELLKASIEELCEDLFIVCKMRLLACCPLSLIHCYYSMTFLRSWESGNACSLYQKCNRRTFFSVLHYRECQ